MLGHNHLLTVKSDGPKGITIALADIPWHTLPSTEAWVIKLEYLGKTDRDPVKENKILGLYEKEKQLFF